MPRYSVKGTAESIDGGKVKAIVTVYEGEEIALQAPIEQAIALSDRIRDAVEKAGAALEKHDAREERESARAAKQAAKEKGAGKKKRSKKKKRAQAVESED